MNQDLTVDEIETIAGGVVQVEVLEQTRSLMADGLRFHVIIRARVSTDHMEELARRIKGKDVASEYRQLQQDYKRVSAELDEWKRRAAQLPPGQSRERALAQIRERTEALSRVQQQEGELYQRLVSGPELLASVTRDKDLLDTLLQTIRSEGFVVGVGRPQATPLSGQESHVLVSLPITVRVSDALYEAVLSTSRAMGGSIISGAVLSLEGGRHSFPLRFGKASHYGAAELSNGEIARPDTAVTLVRISEDMETSTYFQEEVMRLAFIVSFQQDGEELTSCRLGPELLGVLAKGEAEWFPIRRLFPVQAIRQQHTRTGDMLTRLANGAYDLEPQLNSLSGAYAPRDWERGNVAIVREDAAFSIQHRIPVQSLQRLTTVHVRTVSIARERPDSPFGERKHRQIARCAIGQ